MIEVRTNNMIIISQPSVIATVKLFQIMLPFFVYIFFFQNLLNRTFLYTVTLVSVVDTTIVIDHRMLS